MIRKVVRVGGGVCLVLLGITGLILPIMPGWIFLIPGLVILGEFFPPLQKLVDWAKVQYAKHEPEAFRRQKRGDPEA